MSSNNLHDYWESRLTDAFSLEGVGYLGLGRHYNSWLYRVRRRVFLRVMRQIDADYPQSRVLDVGSGTGFYIALWQKLGVRDLVGIDITHVARQQLQARFPDYRFFTLDIGGTLDWPEVDFDVVTVFDVLFHIVDDAAYAQAVANLAMLLKPGGWLIFSENFLHGQPRTASHQVSRTLQHIEGLLADAGFEIVMRAPFLYLMNAPVDSASRLRVQLWRASRFFASHAELLGFALGAVLYPLEVALVTLCAESPTTEIMVCRRRS